MPAKKKVKLTPAAMKAGRKATVKAKLKELAAYDQAAEAKAGLAEALMQAMKSLASPGLDVDTESMFCHVFDRWCLWLEDKYYSAHPKAHNMPESFYRCQETWAKRNKYPSFKEWSAQKYALIVQLLMDAMNCEFATSFAESDILAAYIHAHSSELVCKGIVEVAQVIRAERARKELNKP